MSMIEESDILFGEFEPERLFVIENSEVQKKAGKGIKTVEFIYLTENDNLLFLEAKKTCPNAENKDTTERKQVKYEKFFSDVTDKFIHSINMFAATVLKRNTDCNIEDNFVKSKTTYENVGIKLILVVTYAEESWLQGPKIELEKRLMHIRKIWNADVLVLNKEMAQKLGLVKEKA